MWIQEDRGRFHERFRNSENPLQHHLIHYLNPRFVKHRATKDFVGFHYDTAPTFASKVNCRVFAQNSHCAIEIYDKYAILFDPDYERRICGEHWLPQVLIGGIWESIDLGEPVFSVKEDVEGITIVRVNDCLRAGNKVGELKISWILKIGAFLKHEVKLINLSSQTREIRMILTLIGIAGKRIIHVLGEDDVTITEKERLSWFIRFVDKDKPAFHYLYENLSVLGHFDPQTDEWISDKLKGIRFKLVEYEGKTLVRCDVVIGNYVLTENESLEIDPTISTWQIAAAADDAQANSDCTGFDSAKNRLGHDGSRNLVAWFRFVNVTIAQGATISAAKLTFRARYNGTGTVNVDIWGNDVDDAANPTNCAGLTGKTKTTAKIDWDNEAAWSSGSDYDSDDFTSVVQEIVNRAGWSSGNAMAFMLWGDLAAGALNYPMPYDVESTNAAKLTVDYEEAAPPAKQHSGTVSPLMVM